MRLIDADALKIDYGLSWDDITPTHEEMYALIDRQPTIDAVKHGVWKIYVISMFDGEGCRCSECGFEGAPYWNYCPHCGARMYTEGKEE